MKKMFFLISIFALNLSIHAQNSLDCDHDFCCYTDLASNPAGANQNEPLNLGCSSNLLSAAFHLRHKHVINHIPNGQNPVDIKTVRINIIIVGINNQYPFVWEDDPQLYHFWMEFPFSGVIPHQYCYELPTGPEDPGCNCPSPLVNSYLPDSKIRIEVVNVRYYDDEDGSLANANTSAKRDDIIDMHLTDFPQDVNQLNWYITKEIPWSGNVAGYASAHNRMGNNQIPFIHSGYGQLPYTGQWALIHRHFPHELGHILDLDHTYGGGASASNSLDNQGYWTAPHEHLDDVFAGQSPDNVWDGGHSFVGCNNLMGGGTVRWSSPKQMGRMHRSLSFAQYYGGTGQGSFSNARNFAYGFCETPLEITNNETWNFPYKSYSDIVVKRGATLTLTCRLEMIPQAKIIVEPGATLIVDGGVITSAKCGGPDKEGLWRGIQVWGQDAFNQTSFDSEGFLRQGKIEVKNGAIIEHAQVAIEANKPGSWGGGGGIIIVENSTLRNNWKSIHFTKYTGFNNISWISDNVFEINENWKLPNNPVNFIEGWRFRAVAVQSNTFVNNNPNVKVNGVYVESAGVVIHGIKPSAVDVCDSENEAWLANRFINLEKAIEGKWTGGVPTGNAFGYTPKVRRNIFENCVYSVINSGMPNFAADQNKIFLGDDDLDAQYNVGIYHIGGVNYTIQDNCIEQVGAPMNAKPVGVVVFNTGGEDHRVYRNKSFDVDYAFLGMHKNRSASPQNNAYKGLQFICNENYGDQIYDFAVTSLFPSDPMSGIRYLQGGNGNPSQSTGSISPAANKFSHFCETDASDYFNGVINPMIYFHKEDAIQTPDCYTQSSISLQNVTANNSCFSAYGGIIIGGGDNPLPNPWPDGPFQPDGRKGLAEIKSDFAIVNSQYLAIAIVYNNVIDNGNPQNLMQYVYPNSSLNSQDIKIALMNVSPNISRENMSLLIKENTILTNQDLMQIIAANPDVAHDEELLKMLLEKVNPMDNWMIDFLRNMGTYTTDRTTLEWMFSQKSTERNQLAWEIISRLTEEEYINFSEIYSYLDIIGSPGAMYMKVEDFASKGDFNAAFNVLNNMQTDKMDRWEKMEYQGMISWMSLLQTLSTSNRTIYDLDSTELNNLRTYADNYLPYGKVGVYAKNVLDIFEPGMHPFDLVLPEPNKAPKSGKRTLKTLEKGEISISAFPNPSDDKVIIELNQNLEFGNITVYNVKGEKVSFTSFKNAVFVELNVEKLASGMYIVVLTDKNNVKLAETKLSIQH